jgi:hypothetical protein
VKKKVEYHFACKNYEALNGRPQAGHPITAENEIERRDILGYRDDANDDWSLEMLLRNNST